MGDAGEGDVVARAATLARLELARMNVHGASIVLRIGRDRVTYCIAGPNVAWNDVIVLGTLTIT